jgi:hypothetical protein
MKKKLLKAGLVLFGFVVFIIATAAATVEVRHDRTFDVVEVDVVASTDPDVIERGAYLAYGPAHWDGRSVRAPLPRRVVNQGTHMPWQAYARMSDDDLRAIFRYLRTVEPVENAVGPMVADE